MRRAALILLLASACGGSGTATRQTTAVDTEPTPTPASDIEPASEAPSRLPAGVVPTRYTLALEVDPRSDRFSGRADIEVRLSERARAIWLHAMNLEMGAVHATEHEGERAAGRWEQVDRGEGVGRVVLDREVGPGLVTLHFEWTAPFDTALDGLYRVEVGQDAYAFTQFEPLAARRAFPSFDEPRFKAPFDVTLVVPQGLGAFANTPETGRESAGDRSTHRFATTQPLPTYLVAWAVGPLDVVEGSIPPSDVRQAPLPFRGLAPRGRGPELAYAMEHTPRILAALERFFGTRYPYEKLDIVAVPDFAAGAMENAGLITFRDHLLLISEEAPVSQRRGFAFVMAHELAHQWFGNLVTMAWWDDLWLNEAFATWMEPHIVREVFPDMRAEIAELMTSLDAFEADSLASARRIRNPIETTHDIHNAFDSITYSKGASVLAMFEHFLGSETWRRGIQRYLREHAGGNATAEDLMAALSAEAQRDIEPLLRSFIEQPGVPIVEVDVQCVAGQPPSLSLRQSRYLPTGSSASAEMTWQIPICARFGVGGRAHETCGVLDQSSGTLALEISSPEGQASVPPCPDWVLPNAEGVGYYRFSLPDEWLARLRAPAMLPVDAPGALSTRGRIAMADSVRAGFSAGRVTYPAAIGALEPFANSPDRFVATAPIELLVFAREHLLETDAQKTAFRTYATRLYRDQLRRLGWGPRAGATEDDETRLLRAALLSFLGLTADDPAVRREAQARGRAYAGEGTRDRPGEIHPDAVPADLASLALVVAAQEGGAAFFDSLDRLFGGTQDAVIRGHLLSAMSSVDDPELRPRALALALDPRLRINEVFRPLMGQLGDPEGRDAAWDWLRESYEPLVRRIGPGYAGYLPFAVTGFCSAERASEAEAFFTPRMRNTQGGPRNLESALESIRLCAARAEAHREAARTFFARSR